METNGHIQREVEEKKMTNLTHLSSAHRDRCPRRHWDTRPTPPRLLWSEKRQNGEMSKVRRTAALVTPVKHPAVVILSSWSANSARCDGGSNRKPISVVFFPPWCYLTTLLLIFCPSPWLRFFLGLFLVDCIIRGKLLLNTFLPCFHLLWAFVFLILISKCFSGAFVFWLWSIVMFWG